ncbi:hypothetical protein ACTFIW_010877 [Dictyostelium discoideum]
MSTDIFDKTKGKGTPDEELLKENEKLKYENDELHKKQIQTTVLGLEGGSLIDETAEIGYENEFQICRQYWSKMYQTIKEKINDHPEILIYKSLGIFIKILHNMQLRCGDISAILEDNLGVGHSLVSGFQAFIDKLDCFGNCLANGNYEGVEIFEFKYYKESIQSFDSGYVDLSKSENPENKQLMMDHFNESKRYISLFHFISIDRDQIKMSSSIPLDSPSPSPPPPPPIRIETVELLKNKIFIVNGNQIDFGIDDREINLEYIEYILRTTSNTTDNPDINKFELFSVSNFQEF